MFEAISTVSIKSLGIDPNPSVKREQFYDEETQKRFGNRTEIHETPQFIIWSSPATCIPIGTKDFYYNEKLILQNMCKIP